MTLRKTAQAVFSVHKVAARGTQARCSPYRDSAWHDNPGEVSGVRDLPSGEDRWTRGRGKPMAHLSQGLPVTPGRVCHTGWCVRPFLFSLFTPGTCTRAFGVRANCISNSLYSPLSPAQASSQQQAASSQVANHQKAFQTCQARLSQATRRWINLWHHAGLPYIHTHACPPGPEGSPSWGG